MEKKSYSIGSLAARAYLRDAGYPEPDDLGYECPDGRADMVCADGDSAMLAFVTAKRARGGESKEATVSADRLRRVAMCYIAEHLSLSRLSCSVVSVVIGNGATVSVSAAEDVFTWEAGK